jgi:hypothetical protein
MRVLDVELSDNDVVEIFITAMEGGIGYWSVADEYKWRHLYADNDCTQAISLGDDYVLAVLSDTEGEDFKDLELTPAKIKAGVKWVLNNRFGYNIFDIDSDVADVIVQAGLFGEIVYA